MFIITIRFCHILPFHGFSANFQKLLRILLPIGSTVCSDTSLQAFLSAAASASPAAFCARLIDSHQNITGQLRHGFSAHHRKLPDHSLSMAPTVCSDTSLQAFLSAAASASPAAFGARLIDSHQSTKRQLRHGFLLIIASCRIIRFRWLRQSVLIHLCRPSYQRLHRLPLRLSALV